MTGDSALAQAVENLKKGFQVEAEHTEDPNDRLKIALDHLTEDPGYYDLLEKAGL